MAMGRTICPQPSSSSVTGPSLTSTTPPTSRTERFIFPSRSSKILSASSLEAIRSAEASPSPRRTPSSTSNPRPIRATSSPPTVTDASLTRCTSARTPAYSARMAAIDEVEAYLESMPGLKPRRLGHTEWGIVVPGDNAGGEPIEASMRIADRLLRIQALALHAASDLDPWMLLWWNRQTRLVRFGCSRSKDIWAHADIPVSDADERGVDRLLGLVIEAVVAVRA